MTDKEYKALWLEKQTTKVTKFAYYLGITQVKIVVSEENKKGHMIRYSNPFNPLTYLFIPTMITFSLVSLFIESLIKLMPSVYSEVLTSFKWNKGNERIIG